jgi:hypothetical protein
MAKLKKFQELIIYRFLSLGEYPPPKPREESENLRY